MNEWTKKEHEIDLFCMRIVVMSCFLFIFLVNYDCVCVCVCGKHTHNTVCVCSYIWIAHGIHVTYGNKNLLCHNHQFKCLINNTNIIIFFFNARFYTVWNINENTQINIEGSWNIVQNEFINRFLNYVHLVGGLFVVCCFTFLFFSLILEFF